MAERHGSPWRKAEFPSPATHRTERPPLDLRPHPAPDARQDAGGPAAGRTLTRRTVAGGWQALWCLDQRGVQILQVRRLIDRRILLHCTGCGAAPDLVDARRLLPELYPLWDSIRHEFWTRVLLDRITG